MLLDTNIVICSAQGRYATPLQFIEGLPNRSISIVSYIEALGYHRLPEAELQSLERFIGEVQLIPLTDNIADQAIHLRQQRRMGLGDSIIAATAMTHNLALVTHNTEDFRWINGLELLDPLST